MTTATAINLDQLTTQEARDTLLTVLDENDLNAKGLMISNTEAKVIQYAVANNIQFRDYVLGLPIECGLDNASAFIYDLIATCKELELETYQLETIYAQFKYEQGDSATAIMLLGAGMAKEYSLARLLTRVMVSGATPLIFSAMRAELHPKVVTNLEEDSDKLVNEALRG
jgi:hypothetical protein